MPDALDIAELRDFLAHPDISAVITDEFSLDREAEVLSWDEVDLRPVVAGTVVVEAPTIGARTDGFCLLYSGRSHLVSAETEAGKTWLVLTILKQEIEASRHVVLVDFEDSASSIVERLSNLGVDDDTICTYFHYVKPSDALGSRNAAKYHELLQRVSPTVVVIDGTTESLALEGLSGDSNTDVARWHRRIGRPALDVGAAVIYIDHVVKAKDARGRYALGSQHKLAGIDGACFTLKRVQPFGQGRSGMSRLDVTKDRPGVLRGRTAGKDTIAEMVVNSEPDGRVQIDLVAPESGDFRPTMIMRRLADALQQHGAMSTGDLLKAVTGKNEVKVTALRALAADGYVHQEHQGNKIINTLARPFLE